MDQNTIQLSLSLHSFPKAIKFLSYCSCKNRNEKSQRVMFWCNRWHCLCLCGLLQLHDIFDHTPRAKTFFFLFFPPTSEWSLGLSLKRKCMQMSWGRSSVHLSVSITNGRVQGCYDFTVIWSSRHIIKTVRCELTYRNTSLSPRLKCRGHWEGGSHPVWHLICAGLKYINKSNWN